MYLRICLLIAFLDRKHMLFKVMDMHCWDDRGLLDFDVIFLPPY